MRRQPEQKQKFLSRESRRTCCCFWDVVCGRLCVCVCVCVLSHFSCVQPFATLWTVACQDPLSRKFSRQEYWSGWAFSSLGIFPNQGLNPSLLLCRQVLNIWATRVEGFLNSNDERWGKINLQCDDEPGIYSRHSCWR